MPFHEFFLKLRLQKFLHRNSITLMMAVFVMRSILLLVANFLKLRLLSNSSFHFVISKHFSSTNARHACITSSLQLKILKTKLQIE